MRNREPSSTGGNVIGVRIIVQLGLLGLISVLMPPPAVGQETRVSLTPHLGVMIFDDSKAGRSVREVDVGPLAGLRLGISPGTRWRLEGHYAFGSLEEKTFSHEPFTDELVPTGREDLSVHLFQGLVQYTALSWRRLELLAIGGVGAILLPHERTAFERGDRSSEWLATLGLGVTHLTNSNLRIRLDIWNHRQFCTREISDFCFDENSVLSHWTVTAGLDLMAR